MSLRKALLAASVLTAPVLVGPEAAAQGMFGSNTPFAPTSGLYIAGAGGFNHMDKRGLDAQGGLRPYFTGLGGGGTSPRGSVRFDEGYVALGSIGYGFGNGLRAEVEGNFRYNEISALGGFGRGGTPTITSAFGSLDGQVRQYGVMANIFYDFVIPGFPVQTYVGVGAGYVWTDFDGVRGTRLAAGGNTLRIEDTDGQFAYQGIAGLNFPIAAVPGLSVTAEYRYMGTLEPTLSARVTGPTGALVASGRIEADMASNHSALLGVRYAFGAPRPAVIVAPPAVVQGVARTYLVFFDWDRADLTDRARQIIAEAAAASRNTATTRIEVAGHADRSGTPQYNQRLSQRRAEVVAAELARNGVARSAISISAFGESRPLVPTADGVREPQNRRVEIVLR